MNPFVPTSPVSVPFGANPGDNALATYSMVNQVVTAINSANKNNLRAMSDYFFISNTGPGGSFIVTGGSAAGCADCSDTEAGKYACCCGCGTGPNTKKKVSAASVDLQVSFVPGVYDVTLSYPIPATLYTGTIVRTGNPSFPTDILSIQKINDLQYTLTIFNVIAPFAPGTVVNVPLIVTTFYDISVL
jgi:hypothetical protein